MIKNLTVKEKKGFTMIEILIVLAIIAIMIAVVLPSFSQMRKNEVLKSAVEDVASAINKAKSQSQSSIDSSEYGVHFETNQAVIFSGTAYSAVAASNQRVAITSPASITSITLSGGGSDIYFDRLSGEPNKTGTITISNGLTSKIITISATGSASTN